jgi:hypothetical protein
VELDLHALLEHLNSPQSLVGFVRNILEVITSTLPKGTLVSVASLLAASYIKDILIGATSSGISYHLTEIYSICQCCWNVAELLLNFDMF